MENFPFNLFLMQMTLRRVLRSGDLPSFQWERSIAKWLAYIARRLSHFLALAYRSGKRTRRINRIELRNVVAKLRSHVIAPVRGRLTRQHTQAHTADIDNSKSAVKFRSARDVFPSPRRSWDRRFELLQSPRCIVRQDRRAPPKFASNRVCTGRGFRSVQRTLVDLSALERENGLKLDDDHSLPFYLSLLFHINGSHKSVRRFAIAMWNLKAKSNDFRSLVKPLNT